jgi:hypothetical protein
VLAPVVDHRLGGPGAVTVGGWGQPGALPGAGLLPRLLAFDGAGDGPRPGRFAVAEEVADGVLGRRAGTGPPLLPGADAERGDQEAPMLGGEGVVPVEHPGEHGGHPLPADLGVGAELGAAEQDLGPVEGPPIRSPPPVGAGDGGGHRRP